MAGKRRNYWLWDETFMNMAVVIAQRSKDPNTQVGSIIVSPDNKIVSAGYNGAPIGYSDDDFPWDNVGKYSRVLHSEANSITSCNHSVKDCIIYTTLFPCNECSKLIVQAGIKEVVYLSDKYHDKDWCIVSREILDTCGIYYRQYEGLIHIKDNNDT